MSETIHLEKAMNTPGVPVSVTIPLLRKGETRIFEYYGVCNAEPHRHLNVISNQSNPL